MKKTIISILIIFQVMISAAQVDNQNYIIKATVIESNTGKTLPYANVFNKKLSKGTATNLEGYFELPNNQIGDTIIVSYLGFVDQVLIVHSDMPKEIRLRRNSALLNEVVVTANDDYLYKMIAKVRKNKKTKSRVSKTYFYLETMLFDKPVEIIESYYNGKYSNYGTDELQIKKGRIGLKSINRRYFSSTESSRLFSLYDMFSKSDLFPDNPLSINKRTLKKRYSLDLNHSYMDDDQSKIYVIDFKPKNGRKDFFNGTIWINQHKKKVIKITLNIDAADLHPFIPIGYNTIEQVDMEITKSYQEIDNELFINAIDFNYNVVYSDRKGNKIEAVTSAFSKAYDYDKQFNLPYFEFSKSLHEDYRNMTVVDYDARFWNGTTEFRFYDQLEKVEDFISKNRIKNNIIYPERKSSLQQLQFPYLAWTKERIKMRAASPSKIKKAEEKERINAYAPNFRIGSLASESERYNLNVKLYLDVNTIRDSLTYQIKTILDPVGSFYYFQIDNTDHAFMNMYFDLLEIEKRKLESELSAMQDTDIEAITRLHQKYLNEFNKKIELFVSETKRGGNMTSMEEWNEYIFKHLGIDNLKLFNLIDVEKSNVRLELETH